MSAERYPAVFTGLLSLRKPGEYTVYEGRPPYRELGYETSFPDLPEPCRSLVLDTYLKMWNL